MNKKIYGFIFARGGSKGLPGKNIRPLGGVPLIGRAIQSGMKSGLIEKIFVSTDDPEIAAVAKEYGAEVPFMRPDELAKDTSAEWDAWRHAIENVDDFDIFISLPATAPLRTEEDVTNCINCFLEGDVDVVVTATEAHRHPSFNMITEDDKGYASLVMPLEGLITRRQDAPEVFDMTTVAYVSTPSYIKNNDSVFRGKVKAVIIPPERAIDIDTQLDFDFAEFLLSRADKK
ncbi:MAG: cytidylyltransferase domain-containing protein [Desulfovibrio sp.]